MFDPDLERDLLLRTGDPEPDLDRDLALFTEPDLERDFDLDLEPARDPVLAGWVSARFALSSPWLLSSILIGT